MPPPGVRDPGLWEKSKQSVKKRFKTWPSALASRAIAAEYKKRGGRYSSKKRDLNAGTSRWTREEWVEVLPYAKSGKKVLCGRSSGGKACRPLRRVSPETPMTVGEAIKKHGREKIISMARRKSREMKGRLSFKKGTFKSKKPAGKTQSRRRRR